MRLHLFPSHPQHILSKLQHHAKSKSQQSAHKRPFATETAPRTHIQLHTTINHLPDELITLILLSIQDIDIQMLVTVASVSPRFRCIAMDAIRRYMLPGVRLNTLIDQEGRRRFTTHFFFQSLDASTMIATFMPLTASPKRVRDDNSAAPPTLRHLRVCDSSRPAAAAAAAAAVSKGSARQGWTFNRRQASWQTLDSMGPTDPSWDTDAGALTSKRRPLQVSRTGYHVTCSNRTVAGSSDAVWQMGYHVSTGCEHDLYVTPTFVQIHLSSLWHKKNNHTTHAWTTPIGWIKKKTMTS